MYDAIYASQIPSSAALMAGYVDGNWPSYSAMKQKFPDATVVSIAVFHTDRAQVLDVETGDATPAQAVTWCTQTMSDVPNGQLTIYCNINAWSSVRQAFQSSGVSEPQYWVALYDNNPTIPVGAVAKQYQDAGSYDVSSVVDYWPGVDPKPYQETEMPQQIASTVVPGTQPTVVLPPSGAAWTQYPNRKLHLGMDAIGTPDAKADVRVAIFNGTSWRVSTVTVTAAGNRVDVDMEPTDVKVSLQTSHTGVAYSIESW